MSNYVTDELKWHVDGIEYTILNVPMLQINSDEKEYVDLDVTMKIAMIRDLMYANEIPHCVDFNDVADLCFE